VQRHIGSGQYEINEYSQGNRQIPGYIAKIIRMTIALCLAELDSHFNNKA